MGNYSLTSATKLKGALLNMLALSVAGLVMCQAHELLLTEHLELVGILTEHLEMAGI